MVGADPANGRSAGDTAASDVVVLGSANLDVVSSVPAIPAPGETVLSTGREERPGGKGLNQAVAAARAGARTRLLGAVGDDGAADVLLQVADEAGIDTTLVRRVAGASGTAWIMVRPDGENAIVVDGAANTAVDSLSPDELRAVSTARVLVMQLETPLPSIQEAARSAHDDGARVLLNAAPAQALPDELLSLVDVLVVNEHEARQLSGRDVPSDAAQVLCGRVGAVVITLGARGALILDADGERTVAGLAARVVDTTGAGDAFTGVLAAGLAAGATLDAAVGRAVVAGALAVEAAGAVPSIPDAAQIEQRACR